MKKKTMMKSFLIAGIAAASLGAFAVNNSVQADAATTFAMQDGASVRLTEGSTGIRFTAHVDEVEAGANYGVIIAPTAYFMNNGEYVTGNYHEYLNAKYNVKEEDVVTDLGYIDLASKPTEVTDSTSEYYGKYAIKGSIARMNFDNMNLKFTGIAYKEVDGVYTYATFENFEDISRSVTNVSSRATQDANYETKYTDVQQTVIETFVNEGVAEAANATKTETGYSYNETAYAKIGEVITAINPTLTITGVEDTLSFLRKADVTATFSVAGADVNMMWKTNDKLQVAGNTVQAINIGEGAVTVSAGMFTATETVTVPEPTDMSEAGYVIADMDNGNALSTTIQGFNVALAEAVYDATDAEGPADCVDLQYADGKLGATLTAGEKMIFAVAIDGNTYMLCGIASDCVINDNAEFSAWYHSTSFTDNYAVLANDLTLEGTSKQYQMTAKFSNRTFNGLGNTIYNGWFRYGFFANGRIGTKAVLKNVNFENFIVGDYGIFGSYAEGGIIENVNIQAVFQNNYNMLGGWSGYLWYENTGTAQGTEQTSVKDCTFIFSMPEHMIGSKNRLYIDENHYVTTMTNVDIYSSAGIAKPGEEALLPNGAATAKTMITTNVAKTNFTDVNIYDTRDVPAAAQNSYELLANGKITFTAAAFGLETLPTIAKVYFEGYTLDSSKYTVDTAANTISVACTTYGTKMIIIETADGMRYMTSKIVADNEISNFQDFYNWNASSGTNRRKKQYSVFTQDIDCTGQAAYSTGWLISWAQVLNGRGYKLINYTGDLWSNTDAATLGEGLIVKNMNVENLTGFSMGALGTYSQGVVVDNVHITATLAAGYKNFLLAAENGSAPSLYVMNSSFKFTDTDTGAKYQIASSTFYTAYHTANTTIELTNAEFAADYDESVTTSSGKTYRYGYTIPDANGATSRKSFIYNATLKDTTGTKHWITNEKTGTVVTE